LEEIVSSQAPQGVPKQRPVAKAKAIVIALSPTKLTKVVGDNNFSYFLRGKNVHLSQKRISAHF